MNNKGFYLMIQVCLLMIFFIPTKYIKAEKSVTEIWVVTDIHHLSPSLYDDGEYFQQIQATAGGMDIIYSSQRLEALVMQVEQSSPDLLIVSGDLTLNGEYQSMLELADVFSRIESLGTKVFVIPGNHDISNGWASHFTDNTLVRVRQVLPEDFQHIFADFGYTEASVVDENSLSYVARVNENLVLLMIDSNLYTETEGKGAPSLNGALADATKDWLWSYLDESVTDTDIVIPIVHHNTLTHFDSVSGGYTLDNAEELQKILHYYNIPLILSGHIHAQHINEMVFDDYFTLTEIVTGAFSMAPSAIGRIIVDDSGSINYQQLLLDVDSWAATTSSTEINLLEYQDYMEDLFLESARVLAENRIFNQYTYNERLAKKVNDLYARVNLAVFAGNLSDTWPDLEAEFSEINNSAQKLDNGFFSDYILNTVEKRLGEHQQLNLLW